MPKAWFVLVPLLVLAGCNSQDPTAPAIQSLSILGPTEGGKLTLADESPIEVIEYQDGSLHCWRVTFEGGEHLAQIYPTAGGIIPGSPIVFPPQYQWRTFDASTSPFAANNPSGNIFAFWNGPNDVAVSFVQPVSMVRGYYASIDEMELSPGTVFDPSAIVAFPPNLQPDGFTRWDPFELNSGENTILQLNVFAGANATLLDDFEACRIEFIPVQIDIKPGSDPNCFNNDGNGVIPVAILGGAEFDVTQIDPASVQLEGMAVRAVGKADKLQAHIEDVNADGFEDLVVQIEDTDGSFASGSGTATLTGLLLDGTPIEGSDSICVTQ